MANWKWTDATHTAASMDLGGGKLRSAAITADDLAAFIAGGGVPDAEDPPFVPTLDQIYDATVLQQQVLKAVVLAFIGGTLTVGMTPAQAKAAIKLKM